MRRELRLLPWQSFGAFALLILLGCGGGDEKEASRRPASCPELALEAREARPLQPLAVEGLPDDFAELLAAEVLTEEGDASTTLIARAEGSDTIVLYAPIHPRGLLEGGEVSLEIIDEEGRSCPPIPFTILPLDEAPGTAEAIFERSVELVDGVARAFGTTVEELRSFEVENLPEHLLPLYLAQDSLEAPSNPNSARALLDGVAPNLDGAPLDLSLTDALFASIGLVEALDERLAALEALPPRDPDPTGLHGSVHQGLGRHLVATNAYQLDVDMEWADWGDLYAGENVLSEVIQDATTAIGLLGLVPHPLVKSGVLVTTTSLFAFTKAAEAAANLLPSSFVSIDFDHDPPSFFEGGRLKGLIFVSPLKPIAPEIAVNADLDYGPAIGETGTFPGLSGGELVSTDPTSENSGFESLDPLSIDISRFEMVGELLEIEGMVSGGIHWTYIDGELPEDERDWPGSLLLRFRGTMTKAPFPGEPPEPLFFCNPF